MHVWEHRQSNHPDQVPEYPARPAKDIILSMLAEQNIDMFEEVETLKKEVRQNFLDFADRMEACFLGVREDIKWSTNHTQEAVNAALVSLKDRIDDMDKSGSKEPVHANVKETHDKLVKSDAEVRKTSTLKKRKNAVKKVAWVGTSVSKVLDKKRFEADINVELKIVKAYTITEENETAYPKEKIRFPELIVLDFGHFWGYILPNGQNRDLPRIFLGHFLSLDGM